MPSSATNNLNKQLQIPLNRISKRKKSLLIITTTMVSSTPPSSLNTSSSTLPSILNSLLLKRRKHLNNIGTSRNVLPISYEKTVTEILKREAHANQLNYKKIPYTINYDDEITHASDVICRRDEREMNNEDGTAENTFNMKRDDVMLTDCKKLMDNEILTKNAKTAAAILMNSKDCVVQNLLVYYESNL